LRKTKTTYFCVTKVSFAEIASRLTFSLHFLCSSKENEAKEKTPFAEAFLQLPLQNQSAQPKGSPRLPAFFTVASPYACSPGGFPAPPELGNI
jgi:hypothetical protein